METTTQAPSKQIAWNLQKDYFTGTENYYNYGLLTATDGTISLAEHFQCYWLLDIVASLNYVKRCQGEGFITCHLKRTKKGNGATFWATDGNDNELYRQKIPFTDIETTDEVVIWLVEGVIMLPTEY